LKGSALSGNKKIVQKTKKIDLARTARCTRTTHHPSARGDLARELAFEMVGYALTPGAALRLHAGDSGLSPILQVAGA
jgi:hypothetical protein